jgi:hypothetical protein
LLRTAEVVVARWPQALAELAPRQQLGQRSVESVRPTAQFCNCLLQKRRNLLLARTQQDGDGRLVAFGQLK